MKAIMFERYGPPEVLYEADIPAPVPGDGEVLVRMAATTVSSAACAMRRSEMLIGRVFTGLLAPKVRVGGGVVAGEVVATGAGVDRFAPGDRVMGMTGIKMGAFAEFVTLPQDGPLARLPAGVPFETAAAVIDGYMTALPFLRDEGEVKPGDRVLINGASGSIGTIAVQLAKSMGAEVTAVCSTANLDLVRSLGADHVIDYTREDFAEARGAYDVIFDTVGTRSFGETRRALTPTGIYLTTVPSLAIVWTMLTTGRSKGRRGRLATTGLRPPADMARDVAELAGLLQSRALTPVIDGTYPLEEMVSAHRRVETGHKVGAVLIAMPMPAVQRQAA